MSEEEIIEKALTILSDRLRKPQQSMVSNTDAENYLKLKLGDKEYESFQIMFLDSQNGLISLEEMFKGTINSSAVYPREVVKAALHFNAAAVILSHNHPSGCVEPSRSDIEITKQLVDLLRLFDTRVLDHIVVGGKNSFSFAANGLL